MFLKTPSNQGHGDPSCASHILETHQHHRHQDLHRHHKNDPNMIFYCALHNLQCATLQLISWRLDHAFNQTAVRQSAALIWTPPLIIIVIIIIIIIITIIIAIIIVITIIIIICYARQRINFLPNLL